MDVAGLVVEKRVQHGELTRRLPGGVMGRFAHSLISGLSRSASFVMLAGDRTAGRLVAVVFSDSGSISSFSAMAGGYRVGGSDFYGQAGARGQAAWTRYACALSPGAPRAGNNRLVVYHGEGSGCGEAWHCPFHPPPSHPFTPQRLHLPTRHADAAAAAAAAATS
jgi:hypothetical protein